MKGSRKPVPSRQSGVSGEPILRPFSAGSRMSQTRTTSPTFDPDSSFYNETPDKEANETLQLTTELNNTNKSGDYTIITTASKSRPTSG